jgi:hypothetical protein
MKWSSLPEIVKFAPKKFYKIAVREEEEEDGSKFNF